VERNGRARVLCVDDDPNVLAALHRQLRHRYDVVLARGAAVARERLLDSGPFAVILSDLHMAGTDGLAFLAAARAIAPHTPAILITGSEDAPTTGVPPGLVRQRLTKPCPPAELWAALDAAIGEYEAQRAAG